MRLKLLACKVLQREISLLMAQCENFIDVTYIRQNFHETPQLLNAALQEEIDKLDAGDDKYTCPEPFDAILLGYGLCSNAVTGLKSSRYKLVIPKAHDCITFLLGSREAYDQHFNNNPGTYWYSTGWIENAKLPSKKRLEEIRKEYNEIYGEENAQYLMEMEHNWVKDYKTAAFINWQGINSNKNTALYQGMCRLFKMGLQAIRRCFRLFGQLPEWRLGRGLLPGTRNRARRQNNPMIQESLRQNS